MKQLELFMHDPVKSRAHRSKPLAEDLRDFHEFGTETLFQRRWIETDSGPLNVEVYINEFWTAKQRQANALHEISYRACFKPQLPRFFIERLTKKGEIVYDPFMGRGTTPLEAALLGRVPVGCDINPLSRMLVGPRMEPPEFEEIRKRLAEIDFQHPGDLPEELLVFYHPETLREVCSLKTYLLGREKNGTLDVVDRWIRMVAVNRLTGHSPGFFSVYTLPPNQAVSVESQKKINTKRDQIPPRRHVAKLILRKSRILLSDLDPNLRAVLKRAAEEVKFVTAPARDTPGIPSDSVHLVVTSPPFLNIVQYATDNWLRCWFCGIDPRSVKLTTPGALKKWKEEMRGVFVELKRVLKTGGFIAFEVGEVGKGAVKLEEAVVDCGVAAGLEPVLILINDQKFTKTSNCWGVDNGAKGTNTNRVVIFHKS